MKLGDKIDNYKIPLHPKGITLFGDLVNLEPLNANQHSIDLFKSNKIDVDGDNWKYLPYGPFKDIVEYEKWISEFENLKDPSFFSIIRKKDKKAIGVASYLRIKPTDGSIEVGHINFSPILQKKTEATEAMYLMMKWTFDNGYRRYEWKCNALNIKSRNAAQRLGFSYEGVFRQMTMNKGRNRDTAWFAVIDKEWMNLEKCFKKYLSPDNYDNNGNQIISLSKLTKPYLYKVDNLEFT